MSKEVQMENSKDNDPQIPVTGGIGKVGPRGVAARVALAVSMFLSGCGVRPGSPSQETSLGESTPPQSDAETLPDTDGTDETPLHLPERPDFDKGEGGEYSQEQKDSIERGDFKGQEEILTRWWQYWGNAENRPFHPDTKPIYVYFWDGDGAPGGVLLQPRGDYGSRSFYMPIWNENFLEVPPDTRQEEYDIPVGMGPLELSGGDWVLAWMDGQWVRVDGNGETVERINMQTAQWEREITPSTDLENLSTISIEDFTSGKLQDAESAWIEKNNPFSGREIFSDKIITVRHPWGFGKVTFNYNNPVLMESYLADRSTFPAKIISYYKMQLPEDFFPHPENPEEEWDFSNDEYFLVSQTWLNPNGSYTTLHYLVPDTPFNPLPDNKSDVVPVPVYEIGNLEMVHNESIDLDMTLLYYLTDVKKYMNYSDSPERYLEEWLNNGNLPKELENFIFPGCVFS